MSKTPAQNPRLIAAKILQKVFFQGFSLQQLKQESSFSALEKKDQAFCQQLIFGVCRNKRGLEWIASEHLLQRPIRKKDKLIEIFIWLGLYQLFYLSTKPHAAIFETAALGKKTNQAWATGLINAILRRADREKNDLLAALDSAPEAVQSGLPDWLFQQLKQAYGERAHSIAQSLQSHPSMTLRVTKEQADTLEDEFSSAGIRYEKHPHVADAWVLNTPLHVYEIPGFKTGTCSVQDASAQLAAAFLNLKPGMRILDACAAPGGKTLHLLQSESQIHLTALDIDETRLNRVQENLQRADMAAQKVTLLAADFLQPKTWFDDKLFDAILLDAPCSATGVLRRHPDMKWLKSEKDLSALIKTQQAMLKTAWELLKPGGTLLYATCSLLPAENTDQINWFIHEMANASRDKLDHTLANDVGDIVILPDEHASDAAQMDGFFYARLVKQAS